MGLKLVFVVEDGIVILFERNIGELAEEIRVVDKARHHLHMLLEPAGDRAGLRGKLSVQEIETTLESAFHQCPSVHTGTTRHVISSHVRRCASRCAQPYGETTRKVQKNFRHEVTGITEREFSFVLGLTHQVVVGLQQKILKLDHVLQISHIIFSPFPKILNTSP